MGRKPAICHRLCLTKPILHLDLSLNYREKTERSVTQQVNFAQTPKYWKYIRRLLLHFAIILHLAGIFLEILHKLGENCNMRAFTELLQPTSHWLNFAPSLGLSTFWMLNSPFREPLRGAFETFTKNLRQETFSREDIVIKVNVPNTLLKLS